MNVQDTLREMFEPELLSELESKARHLSVKEGDTINITFDAENKALIINSGLVKV